MLNPQQKDIILATLPVVATNLQTIVNKFYLRVFSNHPELKNLFNQTNQKNGFQQQALANSIASFVTNYDSLSKIKPMLVQIANKHVSLGISKDMYQIVGDNLMAAIGEVLQNILTPEIADAWLSMYWVIANTLIELEQELYQQLEITAKDFLTTHSVVRRENESENTFSIYLMSKNDNKTHKYLAGQYVSIKVPLTDKTHQFRQYSIPDVPDDNTFRITIKYNNSDPSELGVISKILYKNATLGSEWQLSKPAGNFTLKHTQKKVIFLSAGIGITPVFSMLKHLIKDNSNTEIQFIHLTNNSHYHTFKTELANIQDIRLKTYIVYSNPKKEDIYGVDYHSTEIFNIIHHKEFICSDANYYLCGSSEFMQQNKQKLINLGIKPSNIYSEAFEPNIS